MQRTDVAKGTTTTPISIVTNGEETAFYVQSLALAPGASSGWHAHPGPEQSVITKGTVSESRPVPAPGRRRFVVTYTLSRGRSGTRRRACRLPLDVLGMMAGR